MMNVNIGWYKETKFQFPFRRDVLCNIFYRRVPRYTPIGFNSLFVGMCFAILPELKDINE